MRVTAKRILAEPLLHFLAIGLVLFALYAAVKDRRKEPTTIVVGEAELSTMRQGFERTWRRAPTEQEMTALTDSYVREEVLYREGLALGLDRDDSLIRRRVRQRMEFVGESLGGAPEPDGAALQAYLETHGERYRSEAGFTFAQVYVGNGEGLEFHRLLARLNGPEGERLAERAGRPTQLDARMDRASSGEVARGFGQQFAAAIDKLPVGTWQGPVVSDFGLHLVRVAERSPARIPSLAEIREQVERDWLREQVAAARESYYAGLRARYEVRIESQGQRVATRAP